MGTSLHSQAQRLYEVFAELVRGYQFRDRENICCHGVSVSQCYTLDTLDRQGELSMGALASQLHVEISTMTRIVDHLVKSKLAARVSAPNDRRVCCVRISAKGRSLVAGIREELIGEHEEVLRGIPASSREAVITALTNLSDAFRKRQSHLEQTCDREEALAVGAE